MIFDWLKNLFKSKQEEPAEEKQPAVTFDPVYGATAIEFAPVFGAPEDLMLPRRGSRYSAGYDFYAPRDITIPAGERSGLIWTNVKIYLPAYCFLKIENRSSMLRKGIRLYCSGIIDCDYVNNPNNDGNIGVELINDTDSAYVIHKGEKMCQGIIQRYEVAINDQNLEQRRGGFGSTGR